MSVSSLEYYDLQQTLQSLINGGTVTTSITLKRATAEVWEDENPVLAVGEPGYDITNKTLRIGDGTSTWTDLPVIGASEAAATSYPAYTPDTRRTGPVTDQITTIATGIASDAAYNEQYAVSGATLPANWPVDAFGKVTAAGNMFNGRTSNPSTGTVTTFRMMTDADGMAFYTYATGFQIDVFIDGRPWGSNPLNPAPSTGFAPYGLQRIDFAGGAKPQGRLVELRMIGGLIGVYVKKPFRVWKPAPDNNPSIAVVGDSFVAPSVMSDTVAGGATGLDFYLRGVYQRMTGPLGITKLTTDGMGGSGYIAPGGVNMPYGHATRVQWLRDVNPDVAIIHGGGANDIYQGHTDAAIITAAVNYFRARRADLPNAKLVFVEGFAPPLFTPATYNARYKAIRQGVQAALSAEGIYPYYIDVATTRPPLDGTGYVTAPAGNGNSDIYIGSDAVHLTVKGNDYIRGWMVPKIARVLADDGRLAGSLIT